MEPKKKSIRPSGLIYAKTLEKGRFNISQIQISKEAKAMVIEFCKSSNYPIRDFISTLATSYIVTKMNNEKI